jgi:hypothetical protein
MTNHFCASKNTDEHVLFSAQASLGSGHFPLVPGMKNFRV